MPGFQPYVSVHPCPFIRIRFRNRFRKTVSVLPFRYAVPYTPLPFAPYRRMARLAQWAGGQVSRASEWAELQASEKIELDPIAI